MSLKCIWQIFFICSIKSPQCTDKYSKKVFSIAIFLPRVLMYQKRQILLPLGYKTARPKTGDWERLWRHFRTSSFAKNKFLRLTVLCKTKANQTKPTKMKPNKAKPTKTKPNKMKPKLPKLPLLIYSLSVRSLHENWGKSLNAELLFVHWSNPNDGNLNAMLPWLGSA